MLNRKSEFQYLRAIAVIAVVIFHLNPNLSPLGFLGVDLFFFISGFFLWGLTTSIRQSQSLSESWVEVRRFFRRRFFRLAPALGSTVIASLVIAFFFFQPAFWFRVSSQGALSLLGLGNLGAYKFAGNYFNPQPNLLIHTWSLAVEEQVLICAAFISFAYFLSSVFRRRLLVACCLISFLIYIFPEIISPFLDLVGVRLADQALFYLPIGRLWEFGVGYLVGAYRNKNLAFRIQKKFRVLLFFALLFIFFPINPFTARISTILLFAILVLNSLVSFSPALGFSRSAFSAIGDFSYSIYLIHMPVIALCSELFGGYRGNSTNGMLSYTMASILLIVVLTKLQYRFVELPNRRKWNKPSSKLSHSILQFQLIPLGLSLALLWSVQGSSSILNLPPSTSKLVWDLVEDCQVMNPQFQPDLGSCRYPAKNETKKKVFLVGDSHAASLSVGLIEQSKNLAWDLEINTKAGCPFYYDLERFKSLPLANSFKDEFCQQHNNLIIRDIRSAKPDLIIVFQRGSQGYLLDQEIGTLTKYNEALASNIKKLNVIVNEVVWIGPIPELKAQSIVGNLTSDNQFYANSRIEDKLRKKISQLINLNYVSTWEIFCPKAICNVKNGPEWRYVDLEHPSLSGAGEILSKFNGMSL